MLASFKKLDLSPLLIPIKSALIGLAVYQVLSTGVVVAVNAISHPVYTKVEVR